MPQYNESGSPLNQSNTFTIKFNTQVKIESIFKSSLNLKVKREKMYKCQFLIQPHNRMMVKFNTGIDLSVEFKTQFSISREILNQYKCIFVISPKGRLYGKFKLLGFNQNLYKSEFDLAIPISNLFKTTIDIPAFRYANEYKSLFLNRLDKEFMYKCKLFIPPKNTLYGKFKLLGFDQKFYKSDFILAIKRSYRFKANIDIPIFTKDISYKMNVITRLDKLLLYKFNFAVSPKNSMFGIVELNRTPSKKYYGDLIKDTFVNTERPNENFGDNQQVHMSNTSTAYFQWSFNKNKDDLYDVNNETGAYLRLHLKRVLPEDTKITVNISKNHEWGEFDVNAENTIEFEPYKTFDVRKNKSGEFLFDLGNLLKDYDKSNGFNITLAITTPSNNPISINSRERLVNSATLYYEYYYIPPTVRNRFYISQFTVRKDILNHYKSTFKLLSSNGANMYKSLIEIKGFENQFEYKCTLNNIIPKLNYPRYKSSFSIPKFDKEYEFKTNIITRIDRDKDYKTKFNIPIFNKENQYKADIINRIDIEDQYICEFIIPRSDINKEYKSTLTVPVFNKELVFKSYIGIKVDVEYQYKGSFILSKDGEDLKYKCIFTIPKVDVEDKYKSKFDIPLRFFKIYKHDLYVPKLYGINRYKSIYINRIDKTIEFKNRFRIKSFDIENHYKSGFFNLPEYILEFHCEVNIISQNKKVRIFIM